MVDCGTPERLARSLWVVTPARMRRRVRSRSRRAAMYGLVIEFDISKSLFVRKRIQIKCSRPLDSIPYHPHNDNQTAALLDRQELDSPPPLPPELLANKGDPQRGNRAHEGGLPTYPCLTRNSVIAGASPVLIPL